MKRVVLFLLIAFLSLQAQSTQSTATTGFQNWGLGGEISIAVPDNSWGVYYTIPGVGPGVAVRGVVRWKVGAGGFIQYSPSVSMWARWNHWGDQSNHTNVSLNDWELNFNITDVRYLPPIPDNVAIKPYVSLGLIGFSIYHYKEEIGSADYVGAYYNSDTDFAFSQTFALGAEFEVDGNLWPYFEFKFSSGDIGDFVTSIGFTVQH